jgi:LysM repeat protein
MKKTTHQKIRTLLQAAADQALPPNEQMLLDSHLVGCTECRTYAQDLTQLETDLRRVMQQHWNVASKPLALSTIKRHSNRIAAQNQFVNMIGRFAFVPMLAFVVFMVMSVKAANHQQASPGVGLELSNTPSIALIVPKPPVDFTATKSFTQTCDRITYTVQEHDTLFGIAVKHGISKDSLASYNGLTGDDVEPGQVLAIPVCTRMTPGTTTTPTIPNTLPPVNEQAAPSPLG